MKTLYQYRRISAIGFCCLLLVACQTTTNQQQDEANWQAIKAQDFANFYQAYNGYETWLLRAAFSFANDIENGQGKLVWRQDRQDNAPYTEIQLLGPLGVGAVRVTVAPQLSTLRQGKRTYKAPSAQQLMQEILAWSLPVDALSYWVFGLPALDAKGVYQLGEKGHINQLRQLGWVIQFKQYRAIDGIAFNMPRKVFATHAATNTKIRLVVTNFKLS